MVGHGKKFLRVSDLVNGAVVAVHGSDVKKREDQRGRVMRELREAIRALDKLKGNHGVQSLAAAKVLAVYYRKNACDFMELHEAVLADWLKHFDVGQGVAVWGPVKVDGKQFSARYKTQETVLADLLLGAEAFELEEKVERLKKELTGLKRP
jgi:hypothetical protein